MHRVHSLLSLLHCGKLGWVNSILLLLRMMLLTGMHSHLSDAGRIVATGLLHVHGCLHLLLVLLLLLLLMGWWRRRTLLRCGL